MYVWKVNHSGQMIHYMGKYKREIERERERERERTFRA